MERTARHQRAALRGVALSIVLVGATACASGPAKPRAGASLSVPPSISGASTPASNGATTTTRSSSVDAQLGFEKAGILARQAKVEMLLATCMRAQGFEYTPVDPAAREAALVGGSLTEAEFNKQFGYGITTLYEQRRRQAAGGPNEKTRAALSVKERKAYDKALLGGPGFDTLAAALDNGDFSNLGGCTKPATDTAFGGLGVAASVQSKLDDLDQRIKADARMRTALTAWAACMRAAGQPLADPGDVDATLKDRLAKIVGPPDRAGDLGAAPTYDTAALTALQRFEVVLVTADVACEAEHIKSVEAKVRAELEVRFRADNADLLAKVAAP